jgi:hypothetical protein
MKRKGSATCGPPTIPLLTSDEFRDIFQAIHIGGRMKDFMVVTEHPIERVIRVLVGLGGISLVFFGPKSALGWFGLIPLLTGVTGLCPLYTILGFSTCSKKPAKS